MKGRKKFSTSFIVALLLASFLAAVYVLPILPVHANPGYEDFTSYTKVDPSTRITATATHVDGVMCKNETAYLYKDAGTNHFDNFTHQLAVKWVSNSYLANGEPANVWALANDLNEYKWFFDNSKTLLSVQIFAGGAYYIYISEAYGGSQNSQRLTISLATWYYLNITKLGTLLKLYIFTDSARTTQITGSPINITLHGDWKMQYLYAMQSGNWAASYWEEIYNDNLTLGEAPTTPQTPPTINDFYVTGTNSSGNVTWSGFPGMFGFNVSDASALNQSIFWSNNTGSWASQTNSSLSGTGPSWDNITLTFNSSACFLAFNYTVYNSNYTIYATTGLRIIKLYLYNNTSSWNTPFQNLGTAISTVEAANSWGQVENYTQTMLDQQTGSVTSNLASVIDTYDPKTLMYASGNVANGWTNPTNAYDNNTATGASYAWNTAFTQTNKLVLNFSTTVGTSFRYYVNVNTTVTPFEMFVFLANQTGAWSQESVTGLVPLFGKYDTLLFNDGSCKYTALALTFYQNNATGTNVNATVYEVNPVNGTFAPTTILQYSAYCNKLGVTQQQDIKDALANYTTISNSNIANVTLVGYLPYTGVDASSNNVFSPQSKWGLYGFWYANNSWANANMTVWNITAAYNFFDAAVNWSIANGTVGGSHALGLPLWIYADGSATTYTNRYYDEEACTIDCYLIFYALLNVSDALNKAVYWWSYLNTQCWQGSYYCYNPANPTVYECEAAFFLKIISILKYYSNDVGNWTNVLTDLGNRFLSQEWNSVQWVRSDNNQSAYAVVHANPGNSQRRLQNTLAAWQALLGTYAKMNSTYRANMVDMLYGNNNLEPAWALLLRNSSVINGAGLFNSSSNLFLQLSDSATTDYTATAQGEEILFMLGIVPGNTTIAFPLEELGYEYIYDVDPAVLQLQLNSTLKEIRVSVVQPGMMTFQYGTSPVAVNFTQGGVFYVRFTNSWNMILNSSYPLYQGALPSNVIYYSSLSNAVTVSLSGSLGTSGTVSNPIEKASGPSGTNTVSGSSSKGAENQFSPSQVLKGSSTSLFDIERFFGLSQVGTFSGLAVRGSEKLFSPFGVGTLSGLITKAVENSFSPSVSSILSDLASKSAENLFVTTGVMNVLGLNGRSGENVFASTGLLSLLSSASRAVANAFSSSGMLSGLSSAGKAVENSFSSSTSLNILSSKGFGIEKGFASQGLIQLLSGLTRSTEQGFSLSSILQIGGSNGKSTENLFGLTGVSVLSGFGSKGAENAFGLQSSLNLLSSSLFGRENLFGITGSSSISGAWVFNKERLFGLTSPMSLNGYLVSGIEKGFGLFNTFQIQSLPSFVYAPWSPGVNAYFYPSSAVSIFAIPSFSHENLFGLSSSTVLNGAGMLGVEKGFYLSSVVQGQSNFGFGKELGSYLSQSISIFSARLSGVENSFSISASLNMLGTLGGLPSGVIVNPYVPSGSFFTIPPVLNVRAYWTTILSGASTFYNFLVLQSYPTHIQAECTPPQTVMVPTQVSTAQVQVVSLFTVPDINYSATETDTVVGNNSVVQDVALQLPFFGQANYAYHVQTSYLVAGTVVGSSSFDGILSVEQWWLWLWIAIIGISVLSFAGVCIGGYLWRQKQLKKQKDKQVRVAINHLAKQQRMTQKR